MSYSNEVLVKRANELIIEHPLYMTGLRVEEVVLEDNRFIVRGPLFTNFYGTPSHNTINIFTIFEDVSKKLYEEFYG